MKKAMHILACGVCLAVLLAGCAQAATPTVTPTAVPPTPLPSDTSTATIEPSETVTLTVTNTVTQTVTNTPVPTETVTPTTDPRLPPEQWQEWPVIPYVSPNAAAIYQRGLEMGNNPRSFSKIGDCQNVPTHFLGMFDDGGYTLPADQETALNETIAWFAGSWGRNSMAVKGGYNVASVLSPLWLKDTVQCKSDETPMQCEFRIHNPSIVIISMEEWWQNKPGEVYEGYMRQVLDYSIEKGVLPILATKASNLEGDHRINAVIAKLAYEYDIPMWNFWAAANPLPHGGLNADGFHLTYDINKFRDLADPKNDYGWPVRNLTALQALDAVWRFVSK
jgi:hypothetical protein